jgi:hypothetical protein
VKEGIRLDKNKVQKNPGLRALAKLCVNSFWGKFGQRSNMVQTVYFTDPAEYFKLFTDPSNIIHNIQMISENMVIVSYTKEDEFVDVLPNTNTVLAAYVTAHARLKLYSYIENLQDRVLYFDTDSLIYLSRPSDLYEVLVGNYLGQMTNEIEKDYGPTAYIKEFVSGGPKNYGMKVCAGPNEYCNIKVRGFRLTSQVSCFLNFETMKRLVREYVDENCNSTIDLPYYKILRTSGRNVISKNVIKKYKIVYDKRVVLNNFFTVPFGYLY